MFKKASCFAQGDLLRLQQRSLHYKQSVLMEHWAQSTVAGDWTQVAVAIVFLLSIQRYASGDEGSLQNESQILFGLSLDSYTRTLHLKI